MRGVLAAQRQVLFISDFVVLEVCTTIRNRLRTAEKRTFTAALEGFQADRARLNLVDVSPAVRSEAMLMTTTHRSARARSMDVLHVATALQLRRDAARLGMEVTIVTSDRNLADLARDCGLRTFDPSREPLAVLPRAPR
jgi:predicted nucleic acid-binding protein